MHPSERALLVETAESGGVVLVRCLRCQALARRTECEAPYSVSPRHRAACPIASER